MATRLCAACGENHFDNAFTRTQLLKKESEARCRSCVASGKPFGLGLRECSCCTQKLPRGKFSKTQWSKESGTGRCSECVSGGKSGSNHSGGGYEKTARSGKVKSPVIKSGALMPLESTDAFRVRDKKTISPKERLIDNCQLTTLSILEAHFRGLPSEDAVSKGVGSHPEVITPFSHWGLPRNGSSIAGSKAFKKKMRKRMTDIRSMDDDWFLAHIDQIEPYFEEVASMGRRNGAGLHEEVGWEVQIDEIKALIALEDEDDELFCLHQMETEGVPDFLAGGFVQGGADLHEYGPGLWCRPEPTETVAHYVRAKKTIAAKTRLIQYCELRSLLHDEKFESERTANRHPPRQTNNRYWGIPPMPLRESHDKDMAAWKFFVDMDAEWIEHNYDVLRIYFDEVESLYPVYVRSIKAQRLGVILKLALQLAHMGCLENPE